MVKKHFIYFLSALLLSAVYSCKPKESTTEISAGEIDASRYVAIGGSATAGFMDDALYAEGQDNSLGAILAIQFQLIGGETFHQPLMPQFSVGCNVLGLSAYTLNFKTDCLGATSLSPLRIAAQGDIASFQTNVYNSGTLFANFGIPSLKITEMDIPGIGNPANGPGNYNPYFARMASSQSIGTVKGDIIAKSPTFFTVYNDIDEVLEFAKSGATEGALTPINGPAGVGFEGSLNDLLSGITIGGAKGAIATIPDITEFPFFSTIPYDGLNLDAEKAQTLNDIYNPIGIYFQVGKNAFVIEDPSAGSFGVRQMVAGELILLSVPLDSVKCNKMGSVFPFRDEFVLKQSEISMIRTSIEGYNQKIETLANTYDLALVDAYSFYKNIKTGIVYNGISLTTKFVSGGTFSLDGITLNPRGNALLANEFIKAINVKYQSKVPTVDATKFRGIIFP